MKQKERNCIADLLQVFHSTGFHPATSLLSRLDDLLNPAALGDEMEREEETLMSFYDPVCLQWHFQPVFGCRQWNKGQFCGAF